LKVENESIKKMLEETNATLQKILEESDIVMKAKKKEIAKYKQDIQRLQNSLADGTREFQMEMKRLEEELEKTKQNLTGAEELIAKLQEEKEEKEEKEEFEKDFAVADERGTKLDEEKERLRSELH
jgi:uncharacterized phage infection (PIP) family protein YhgE